MEPDEDTKLILQLLSEDLEELQHKQKGKQRAGNLTDLELALACMGEEILRAQTSIDDGILAASTSTAIATDQNILLSFSREERIASQDRHFALTLNGNPPPADALPAHGDVPAENDVDAISIAMGDIMRRVVLPNSEDRAENAAGPASSSRRAVPGCASCFEDRDIVLFMDACRHGFCHGCTRQMFLMATKDEGLYPPRCCGRVVSPGVAMRVLDYKELRAFCERGMEYSAKDRVYCADRTCSRFIPPFAIEGEFGTCRECGRQTHVLCRALAHPGVDCPSDTALQETLLLAEAEHWRRCYNCHTMVELNHGCNHIRCRCGKEFCYVCGQRWKTCHCPLWHENRLVEVVNQAVEQDVAPNADLAYRRYAFNRIREGLLNHENVGCHHNDHNQWQWRRYGSLQCEVCHDDLPEYIFVCTNCRMRACYRCQLHRL
ncbi:hypothetical protein BDV59DRAFT_200029 [Aspergillus ambiguus]|uniref:Rcat domain-containing protein n=1 Tax=Aspergillus ambiguus TaxID=176160 RepID=UPI003CCD619C